VSADAGGTFTVGFVDDLQTTFLGDANSVMIQPITLTPALISVGIPACCLPTGSCSLLTAEECAAVGGALGASSATAWMTGVRRIATVTVFRISMRWIRRSGSTMGVEHLILYFAALFAGGGGTDVPGLGCQDPLGLCSQVPYPGFPGDCDCEGACFTDVDCGAGWVCRQEPLGPSTCACVQFLDPPGWIITFDLVGRCEVTQEPGRRPYTIIELGTFGGLEAFGGRVNNQGQVVGFAGSSSGGRRPFLWEDGELTNLFPNNTNAFLDPNDRDINDLGGIVFDTGEREGSMELIYLWQNGTLRQIGQKRGNDRLQINNLGQVLMGDVIWQDGETIQISDLSDPPLDARVINNLGHLGGSIQVGGEQHAALLIDGQLIDLGTFGAKKAIVTWMNDLGQVNVSADGVPFLWADGQIVDLRKLTGLRSLRLSGINNCGEMVGVISVDYPGMAVGWRVGVYFPGHGFRFLDSLIDERWYSIFGSINERGQIAGGGTVRVPGVGWVGRAFLATPVPGDLTIDGSIDLNDYALFFERFGYETTDYSIYCNRADFDEDGDTDLYDFGRFQTFFTGGGPQ